MLGLFPEATTNAELRAAAQRLRFQLGQADRFRAGLVRSGAYKPYIHEAFVKQGLPRELGALPHVESSFDPTAYSKVGAAGMWQFMRSTGVRYMRIDHIVDERRDPFLATDAAVRLLADNYSVLQSWPLALTAYNHGVSGMRRATHAAEDHRHRDDRPQVPEPLVRLRVTKLLRGVSRRAADRFGSAEILPATSS